jgi:hypothetical protein
MSSLPPAISLSTPVISLSGQRAEAARGSPAASQIDERIDQTIMALLL